MSEMVPALHAAVALPAPVSPWLQLALAAPVVLWGGWPFFVRGVRSVATWNLNMFTLIGLGVAVAFVGCRHHDAGAARPGAGAARAQPDVGRIARIAGARAADGAAHR